MRTAVVILSLMLCSALVGFYGPRYLFKNEPAEIQLLLADATPSRPVGQNFDLGCREVVEATAQESVFDPKSAIARSGLGTDNAAIHISPDKKSVTVLFAYDVSNGATEGQVLVVRYPPRDTDTYLVATAEETLSVHSLILNLKTMKAVYTFTGQGMLGIKGYSTLMICH
jgi:hypothetical protein